MAFPTTIDAFTSPSSADYLNSPAHATQHSQVNTAINEVEKKIGSGDSDASTATANHVLVHTGGGATAWGITKSTLTTDADAATITFDMDASNIHQVTLANNRILAVSNVDVGQSFVLRLIQDGVGSRTVTWFTTIKWVDGVAPTLTTTLSKTDVFGFMCTSAGNYDGYIIGQNL